MSSIPDLLKQAHRDQNWDLISEVYKELTGQPIFDLVRDTPAKELTRLNGHKKGRLSKADKQYITERFDDSAGCIQSISEEMNRKPTTIAKFIKDNNIQPTEQTVVDLTQPIAPQLEQDNGVVGTRDNSENDPETDGQSRKMPYQKKNRLKLNKFSDDTDKIAASSQREAWLFDKTPDYKPSPRKPEMKMIESTCIGCGKKETVFISALVTSPGDVGDKNEPVYKCNKCTSRATPQTV